MVLLFALAAVLVVEAAWLWPILAGDAALFARDIMPFRLPYHAVFGQQLADGKWPVWTPLFGGGMPLWHHPSAELADPSTLVFAFLPPHQAYGVKLFVHMAAATIGVALLCRSLRVHPVLCAWAGLLFVCSGPVASCWTVKFIPTTALPFVALAGRTCAQPLSRRHQWLVPLSVAFMLLHPDPPAVAGTLLVALAFAVGLAPRGRRGMAVGRLAIGTALGVLLAAPFLLPAAAVVQSADRSDVVQRASPVGSIFHWLDALAPGATGVGGAAGANAGMAALRDDETGALVASLFIGMTAVAALLAGLASLRRRLRIHGALLVAAAVLSLLARGETLPVLGAAWRATTSRFPDKLLLPAALALIVLSAQVVSMAIRAPRRLAWAMRVLGLFAVVGIAMIAAGAVAGTSLLAPFDGELRGGYLEPASERLNAALMQSGTVIVAGVVALWLAFRRTSVVWLWLLLIAGGVEAITSVASLNAMTAVERLSGTLEGVPAKPYGNSRLYSGNPAQPVAPVPSVMGVTLGDDESIRIIVALGDPLSAVLSGARYVANADASRLEPAPMHVLMEKALPHLTPVTAVRVLHRLGVERFVVRGESWPEDVVSLVAPYPLGVAGTWVDLVAREPFPLVSLEIGWLVEDDLQRATTALARPLAQGPRVVVGTPAPRPDANPEASATVHIDEMTPTAGRFTTRSASAALLVVREVAADGWAVAVDGQPATLLRANICQRAVYLPPGDHVVEMRYRVPNARAGAWVGLIGLVALAVRFRRR